MKMVRLWNRYFSKLICGTNAFYGLSHFSNARNIEYKNRFTDCYIEKIIRYCISNGINTIESSANERIYKIISKIRNDGLDINFVGSTRIDDTSEIKSYQMKLDFLIEKKADVCIIHSQFVDEPRTGNEIKGLKSLVDKIHEVGLVAGISTHMVSTVEICEQKNYGIDVYLFPLNEMNFVYPGYKGNETLQDRVAIVKGIAKPFILM